jgi:hypothetical protein
VTGGGGELVFAAASVPESGRCSVATPDLVRTRESLAGAGAAVGARAPFDAVEEAVEALGREPGLVLIFPTGVLDPQEAATQAQTAAGSARVAGMTGTGAITSGGAIESGCSALAFASSLSVGVGTGSSTDPRDAGRSAAADALSAVDRDEGHAVLLLFVDSESGDQAEIVAGAYEIAGGRIPLAGGAAGGEARAQFADGEAMSGSVVAVALVSPTPIGVGISHGCVPRGAPSIVTRSRGGVVLQLDGRPAETVYLEKLGMGDVPLSDADFETIAMAHPLAQPELRGDVRPRYVRGRAPGGGLICATSIEANAAVDVCEQKPEATVRSAIAAVNQALGQLSGPAEAAVLFDCAARSRWFGNPLASREVDSLISSFGVPPPALAGAYTRGEIGRIRGAKGDRNYSLVVVAFGSTL